MATPSTNPGTPDGPVFWIAIQGGRYSNFDNIELQDGLSILMWNGSSWNSQQIISIDDTPTAGSENLVKSGGVADMYGSYIENPEFAYVQTDNEDKILFGVKQDGSMYFGEGCPTQVKDYIDEKLAELSLDEYEDIVAFLSDYLGSDTTLKVMLDALDANKVDKEEGKSLINSDYASTISSTDSPEFLEVTTDSEDKILEGIQADGTKVIGGDLNVGGSANINGDIRVLGNMEVSGVSYKVIENPEFLAAWVDAEDKVIFGLKTDGKTYVGDANFLSDIKNNQEAINEIKSYLVNFDIDALSSITTVESPEFIDAKTDLEGKLLAGRTADGAAFESIGFSTPKVSTKSVDIDGHVAENIEDPEGRTEIKTDSEGKILSYRDSDGVLHENVGIETEYFFAKEAETKFSRIDELSVKHIDFEDDAISNLSKDLIDNDIYQKSLYKRPNVPKYGVINIKTESFYLTADPRVSSLDDLVLIQDYEDTDQTARDRMTISHYYIKETLTANGDGTYSINSNSEKLTHYASGKVKLNSSDNKYYAKETIVKLDGVCYYADTLGYFSYNGKGATRTKVIDGYTRTHTNDPTMSDGDAKTINVEVSPYISDVHLDTWVIADWDFNAIDGTDIGKKYGHNCIVDVDFGFYYKKNNVPIEIKHQGNSTQGIRKRNFRFTFYKKNDFAKKDKIKIGEMLRLSGYNLKSNWRDNSRIMEEILYRFFISVWNSRPITNRYNWDDDVNGYYHGATGLIEGFPIRVNVCNEFYGIYIFGLKKDEKNYMLDGKDENGLFVSGSDGADWGVNYEEITLELAKAGWDDEMMDEMSNSTAQALSDWQEFLQNRLYLGSDTNYYHNKALTEIEGIKWVTASLVDGEPTAESISCTLVEFNKENCAERIDVLGFIDYLIFLQVFNMVDSTKNNVILYSDAEKKKMWPFFYDLDGSMFTLDTTVDMFGADTPAIMKDVSVWQNIRDLYWDEIVNRYSELRKGLLSVAHIENIYNDVNSNIPSNDFANENTRWGVNVSGENFKTRNLTFIKERLEWLDKNYFIN